MSNTKFISARFSVGLLAATLVGVLFSLSAHAQQNTLLPPSYQGQGIKAPCIGTGGILASIDMGTPPQGTDPQLTAINCVNGATLNSSGALTVLSLTTTGSGVNVTNAGTVVTNSGNISSTSGSITTTSGNITTTSGNITTTSGNITATNGSVSGAAVNATNGSDLNTFSGPLHVNGTDTNGYGIDIGNSPFHGGKYYHTSDMRLKSNIHPVEHALDKLLALHGVEFNWKKDGQADMGVVAQNVAEVFPNVVTKNSEGMMSVEYDSLVGPMIEAMRDLNAKNDKLEHENEILKAKVSEMDSLKAQVSEIKASLHMPQATQ